MPDFYSISADHHLNENNFYKSYKSWLNFKKPLVILTTTRFLDLFGLDPSGGQSTALDGEVVQCYIKFTSVSVYGLENIARKAMEWTEKGMK